MKNNFDYDRAEDDLWEAGCHDSEDIFSCHTDRSINDFMLENGLNPDDYRHNSHGHDSSCSNDNGGCYLTSACVRARGMADDCSDLMTLRKYRDNYLRNREGGSEDIEHYYRTAPVIVDKINDTVQADSIWSNLYEKLVAPCVSLIGQGRLEEAYELYKGITLQLEKKYLES